MTHDLVPLGAIPGSKPIKRVKWEHYARLRAQCLPRVEAFRRIGHDYAVDKHAYNDATKLEKRPLVRDRIAYLVKQAEERTAEKRAKIEEQLWGMAEADIGAYFERYETEATETTPSQIKMRPKLLDDLDPESRKLIESVELDSRGRLIPQLYSKLQVNKELRAFYNFGKQTDQRDVTQLSDAELVAQLAQQAKELGVEIDLSYSFAPPKRKQQETDDRGEVAGQTIDLTDQTDVENKP